MNLRPQPIAGGRIHRVTAGMIMPSGENMGCCELSSDRLPLLITGVPGVAGWNAWHYFRARYGQQVVGQRPVNNWPLSGEGIIGCNLEDTANLKRLLARHKFRAVLNCGGSCALKSCELDPEMAWRVNVQCVESLLQALQGTDIRLVHLSIDLVFSGMDNGGYCESDVTDPVTVYGKTMVVAEDVILSGWPEACILRISLPMGISFNGHAGAIDWIQSRFKKNKPATLYYDEVRTPTYVDCLNEVMEEVLNGTQTGLFHAGGPRRLSLYQIAQIVNRVGGYDPRLLKGCNRIEAGPIPPRAGNVTMDGSRLATELGRQPFSPWPLNPCYVPLDRHWHFQRDQFEGSTKLLEENLYRRPAGNFDRSATKLETDNL
jgi:dTDP-4-dehydrorhamnose reductase